MQEKTISIPIKVYQFSELPPEEKNLVELAKDATRRSLAPYSGFHVGAAILLANGQTVTGSNQENVAYPSGTCAERTACFYASSQYPGVPMRKIAIAAWTRNHDGHREFASQEELDRYIADNYGDFFQNLPISPCGACRQALLEYETMHGPIEVILYGRSAVYVLPSVASLLPLCFTEF